MKKLLVLVLVLGMSVMANAAVINFAGDNTPGAGNVSISVSNIGEWLDGFMVVTIQGAGTLTSQKGPAAPTEAALAGTMAEFDLATTYGNGDVWTMISSTSVYPSGVWINAAYAGAVAGDVLTARVSLDGATWTDLGSITIVPEPATMVILALGGLLFRRK
jgi:hypothetical protein